MSMYLIWHTFFLACTMASFIIVSLNLHYTSAFANGVCFFLYFLGRTGDSLCNASVFETSNGTKMSTRRSSAYIHPEAAGAEAVQAAGFLEMETTDLFEKLARRENELVDLKKDNEQVRNERQAKLLQKRRMAELSFASLAAFCRNLLILVHTHAHKWPLAEGQDDRAREELHCERAARDQEPLERHRHGDRVLVRESQGSAYAAGGTRAEEHREVQHALASASEERALPGQDPARDHGAAPGAVLPLRHAHLRRGHESPFPEARRVDVRSVRIRSAALRAGGADAGEATVHTHLRPST